MLTQPDKQGSSFAAPESSPQWTVSETASLICHNTRPLACHRECIKLSMQSRRVLMPMMHMTRPDPTPGKPAKIVMDRCAAQESSSQAI